MAPEPSSQLASRILPAPLYRALLHIFAQGISNCVLVGGTALAGYYAGHRRSDDLDLFVLDEPALAATRLAVDSLTTLGAEIVYRQRTRQFFDATCTLSGHIFSVQIVLDHHLFSIAHPLSVDDGVCVIDLPTLLRQKAATLISRCSEKDLYDLRWLFEAFPQTTVEDLVSLGAEIDAGMTAETAVISVTGAHLRSDACDFSLSQSADSVYGQLCLLRESLAVAFDKLARKQPIDAVGELVRLLKSPH